VGNPMMSLKKGSLNASQAETYYEEKYTQDDYYSEQQRVTGRWMGKGAAELGLAGDVSREDFSALLQGFHPRSGAVLVPKASGYDHHAAGWDGVFNAPKSVSTQALVGEDHRLLEGHKLAVERALVGVEKYAMARQRGGRELVNTENVTAAAFTHVAARPVRDAGHGPDPHLHTHVVFLNITKRPDGEIRALSPVEIYRCQRLASAIYRSELSQYVQGLGYGIHVNRSDGRWELEGYTREQVMAFSTRRQQIENKMAALSVTGAKAAQIVALETRASKEQYDETQLKAEWQQRAAEYGIDTRQLFWQALGRQGTPTNNAADARDAVEFARVHTTNREAVVSRRDLEVSALQHGMGRTDPRAVRQQIQTEHNAGQLIPTATREHPQGSFTTPEMLALEADNLRIMRAGQGQAKAIAAQFVVENFGKRKGLSDEQINAATMMLTAKNWMTAIDALAGTGKTTTVGAIRELAEEQGYTVRSFGPTTKSVQELQNAGLSGARTIASLLASELPAPTGPEVWFVDEHSMMDSLTGNRLLNAAIALGVEHIILVGDTGQHQAIQAGNPVKQFIDAEMTVARLETIRRQIPPELRAAVKAARYTPAQAFDLLDEQGRITEIPNVDDRYAAIAAEYLKGHEMNQQTLAVSPGNDERRDINATIRKLLVERGHIDRAGCTQEVLVDHKFTPAQIRSANSYQEGDVLLARGTREQQKQGLAKNSYAVVEAVDRRGNSLVLRTAASTLLEVFPARWEKTDAEVFTSEQRTLAVGDRVQFRRPDHRHDIANGQFATIVKVDTQGARFHVEGKTPREISLPFAQMKHLDYGYCSTTFSAQGGTVEKCIMHADSMRSERLLNRAGLYVGSSRPKLDLRVFTDDAEALRRAVVRDPQKSIALEAVNQQLRQSQTQSTGIRI
jgi:conjugative relaxase-like TrwC/TraI family protein